jgi:DNA-binding Lrp family transcriptional regulator
MNNRQPQRLDAVDQALVGLLSANARIRNAELAERVGIAASTTHLRLRSLLERGVVEGFPASIDQAALGRSLQAMVGVTLRPGSRKESIAAFSEAVRHFSEVVQTFFVGGSDDFIVHVAVEDSSALRAFVVEHISGQPSVASTRTSVIFSYERNAVVAPFD